MNKSRDEVLARLQEASKVIGVEAVNKLNTAGFMIMDAADVVDLWEQYTALAMVRNDLSLAMLDIYAAQLRQDTAMQQASAVSATSIT